LIGMRVNSLLAAHRWGGVARAKTRMQAELAQTSALGQKRSFIPGSPNVRFAPKAVIRPLSAQCALRA